MAQLILDFSFFKSCVYETANQKHLSVSGTLGWARWYMDITLCLSVSLSMFIKFVSCLNANYDYWKKTWVSVFKVRHCKYHLEHGACFSGIFNPSCWSMLSLSFSHLFPLISFSQSHVYKYCDSGWWSHLLRDSLTCQLMPYLYRIICNQQIDQSLSILS